MTGDAAAVLVSLEREGQRLALTQAAERIAAITRKWGCAMKATEHVYAELVKLHPDEQMAIEILLAPLCQALEFYPFEPPRTEERPRRSRSKGPLGPQRVN